MYNYIFLQDPSEGNGLNSLPLEDQISYFEQQGKR